MLLQGAEKFQDRQRGDKYSKVRQHQPRSWLYSYTGTQACNPCFIANHQDEIFKMLIIGVKVKELEWIKAAICSVQLHLKPTLIRAILWSFILKNLFYLLIFFSQKISKIGMLMTSLCFVCEPPYQDNFNLRLLPTELILICSRQLLATPGLTAH